MAKKTEQGRLGQQGWAVGLVLGVWLGMQGGAIAQKPVGKPIRRSPVSTGQKLKPKPVAKPGGQTLRKLPENVAFRGLCVQRDRLSPAEQQTMAVLLRVAGTTQCDRAAQVLAKQKLLDLSGTGVSDLRPVGVLTSLETLVLSRNPVKDLSPVGSLVNLKKLVIRGSGVKDLGAIARLRKLQSLAVDDAVVEDVSPLADLPALQDLSLQNNRIRDISALASLKSLTTLSLQNNQIQDLSPLTLMVTLRELHLDHNDIQDVRSLSGLMGLRVLTLNDNFLKDADYQYLLPLVGLRRLELLGMPTKINPCPSLGAGSVCMYHRIPDDSSSDLGAN